MSNCVDMNEFARPLEPLEIAYYGSGTDGCPVLEISRG